MRSKYYTVEANYW